MAISSQKKINNNRIYKPKFVLIKIGDTDLDEEDVIFKAIIFWMSKEYRCLNIFFSRKRYYVRNKIIHGEEIKQFLTNRA